MASQPLLNVFSGPDALKDYYDPDKNPPLPLVEIPSQLNPLYDEGVHIYAKMMTFLPAHNVKELPALQMLSSSLVEPQSKSIVEYSSGSTVISMGIVARILHGITDTRAYISNKTSEAKLKLLQFFGLELTLFGGPSQPEPTDPRGGIQRARHDADSDDTIVNLNQYENDDNWRAHQRWTGPQILKQLPSMSIFCAGMGTAGTLTGTATFLKENKPSITTLGVTTAPGDRVPGPRSFALLAPVKFPWKDCVDEMVECGSQDAFTTSLHLSRYGILCGPSSGFNLVGLLKYLTKCKEGGTLDSLRSENGSIDAIFICCDLPYQYIDEYFEKVPLSEFHPIKNKELAAVDVYRYDDAWELVPQDGKLEKVLNDNKLVLVDLRDEESVRRVPRPQAQRIIHVPLKTLHAIQTSPYYDSTILTEQWKELAGLFDQNRVLSPKLLEELADKTVLLVCHGGDTSRMASSILRANGVAAWSLKGGAKTWEGQLEQRADSPLLDS